LRGQFSKLHSRNGPQIVPSSSFQWNDTWDPLVIGFLGQNNVNRGEKSTGQRTRGGELPSLGSRRGRGSPGWQGIHGGRGCCGHRGVMGLEGLGHWGSHGGWGMSCRGSHALRESRHRGTHGRACGEVTRGRWVLQCRAHGGHGCGLAANPSTQWEKNGAARRMGEEGASE
jgi:hypothetical protein